MKLTTILIVLLLLPIKVTWAEVDDIRLSDHVITGIISPDSSFNYYGPPHPCTLTLFSIEKLDCWRKVSCSTWVPVWPDWTKSAVWSGGFEALPPPKDSIWEYGFNWVQDRDTTWWLIPCDCDHPGQWRVMGVTMNDGLNEVQNRIDRATRELYDSTGDTISLDSFEVLLKQAEWEDKP